MRGDFSISAPFQILAGLVFLSLFTGNLTAQETIDISVTVPAGEVREFPNGVNLTTNDAHLIVYGTVIINGNLEMSGNKSNLTLYPESVVIVYGDVIASNQVTISALSYFIVYGNLTRITGSNQGTADFEEGDVYVFGSVDPTWEIDKCDATVENCDYKDEDDLLEENLPPQVQEAMNCFDIPPFSDITTCEGQDAIFSLSDPIMGAETFQWQERDSNGLWVDKVNETSLTLTIPNVQPSMNGNSYRLIVRSAGGCKMGVSKPVSLNVTELNFTLGEIQGETDICEKTGPFTYTITEPATPVSFSWQIPETWMFDGNSETNSISVIPSQASGEIKVTVTNSCGTQIERSLSVKGRENIWNGSVNSLWEEPQNWKCGIVPTSSTAVTIPLNTSNYPVINEGITGLLKNINVEAGASLTILGDLDISGTISGTLNAQSGTIRFSGSVPQIIPSTAFFGDLAENIIVNNPSQVTLEGPLKVSGVVKTTQGDLVSSGFLTLTSDKDRTALISGTGSGSVVGIVNLQRFLEPAFGYKYFSSPLKGITVTDFDVYIDLHDPTTGFPHFYRYEENREDSFGNDLTGWESYTTPSLPLKLLEGYAVNFGESGGPVTLTLSGEVIDGPQSRNLTNNNGIYSKGFNLVGNPYPSPVDWNKAEGWTNANIDDAVYFFNASSTDPYTGTYSSYVQDGPSSDGKTTSIIPSMQGFFVHVIDGSTQGTFGINDQARTDDQSQNFYKAAEEGISLLRIRAGFEKEEYGDPTVIYFTPTAKVSFDKSQDALKLMNTNPETPSFYSLTPDKQELSINALPVATQKDQVRIPLGYSVLQAGNLKIELQDIKNLPLEFQVYLVDLEKNLSMDLLREKAYITYVSKGSSNKRFELVLSKEAITDPEKLLDLPMSVHATKEKITVSLNLEMGDPAEIVVTSISGQVLKTLTASSKETVEIKGIKSAGVYIISLVSGETRYSKKILIN